MTEIVVRDNGTGTLVLQSKSPSIEAVYRPRGSVDRTRAFSRLLKYTPLLWASGLLPLLAPLVIVAIFFRDRCWKHLKDPAVGGWFAVGVVQMFATLMNWSETTDGFATYVYRCLSAPISGWFVIGILTAIGKELSCDVPKILRGGALVGLYILILGVPVFAIGIMFGITDLAWLTPVGYLIPSSLPSAQFEFTAVLLSADDFVGQTLPRLVLFYPWPTCLGFSGAAIFFMSLVQSKKGWRILGLCGGLFAVVASTSRAAVVGTLLGLVAFWILRIERGDRAIVAFSILTIVLICLSAPMLFGVDPISLLDETAGGVSALRQDSSSARDLLYKETYRQFETKPYLGHGWQGENLEDTIPLPIGSHSSIYGLLYTGGIITLIPFVVTVALLGGRLVHRAVIGGGLEQTALCVFVVLIVMCYGECIFSFGVPVFFAFLWIGAGLGNRASPAFTPVKVLEGFCLEGDLSVRTQTAALEMDSHARA